MARRRKRRNSAYQLKPGSIDYKFLILALSILSFGIIMVLSAGSTANTFTEGDQPFFYVIQQIKWALLGIVVGGLAMVIPYPFWRKFAGLGILFALTLLLAVLYSDAGHAAKGSARWLSIAGVSIQPSEFAKLALVLFYAHILELHPVKSWRHLGVPLLVLAPILLLVLKQPDLGTAIVILAVGVAMLLQTELSTRYFLAAAPVTGLLGYLYIRGNEYQMDRIRAWLDPWKYASGDGYQIANAQIAFGSGGLFGVGLGRSAQKNGFLPENHTDTIFAIVGEELGLVGATVLLILFILLFRQGYLIARRCPDRFGRLLAYGLTSLLGIQTAINLAVVTGVFPVTGITLPLISYGGNSLLVTLVEIGILLNISRYREEPVIVEDGQNIGVKG